MNLTLIKKSDEVITSLKDAKNYLRVDHDFDDGTIKLIIKATQEALEMIAEKSILKKTWKYEINFEDFQKILADRRNVGSEYVYIPLPKLPVLKITKVSAGGSEINSEKYKIKKSKLALRNSQFTFSKANFSLVIEYDAGMANTVDEVPNQLKLAHLLLISNAYNERFIVDRDKHPGMISKDVRQLVMPFLDLHFA